MDNSRKTDAVSLGRRDVLSATGATLAAGAAVGPRGQAMAQTSGGMSATARNSAALGLRLQGVQHFGLTVQNMERAYEFDTEVLGQAQR